MKNEDYGLYYHLALARYLTGDFAKAADTYDGCIRTAQTPDNRTSCQAWQYLAFVRAGRKADAQKLLDAFAPEPNQAPSAYIDRLLLFKGVKTEEEVAKTMEKDARSAPDRRLQHRRLAPAERTRGEGARGTSRRPSRRRRSSQRSAPWPALSN